MPDYPDVLRAARRSTAPSTDSIEALEAQVRGGRRRANRGVRPVVLAGVGALALAAAAVFVLREPVRVDRALDHGQVALGALVSVKADGAGQVRGTAAEMRVEWTAGSVDVEVEPNRGVKLAVVTPEGEVRVVGTGFSVSRDGLGTSVAVRHGKVAVDCARGDTHTLVAGESVTCAPATAAGSLARVLVLRDTLPPAALRLEIDAALALPEGAAATLAELHALRAGTLLESGDAPAALVEAETTLQLPGVTRAEELHRLAARLRLQNNDCAGALPHLMALRAAGVLGDDAPALEICEKSPGE